MSPRYNTTAVQYSSSREEIEARSKIDVAYNVRAGGRHATVIHFANQRCCKQTNQKHKNTNGRVIPPPPPPPRFSISQNLYMYTLTLSDYRVPRVFLGVSGWFLFLFWFVFRNLFPLFEKHCCVRQREFEKIITPFWKKDYTPGVAKFWEKIVSAALSTERGGVRTPNSLSHYHTSVSP